MLDRFWACPGFYSDYDETPLALIFEKQQEKWSERREKENGRKPP
jgi:hypothetical protein